MKTYRRSLFVKTLGLVFLVPGTLLAQDDADKRAMSVVVKLRAHHLKEPLDETAAGIFVGKDRQYGYFITACHAVIREGVMAKSVDVQFHDGPQSFDAIVLNLYDSILDVAVIEVPVVNLPPGLPEIVKKDATLKMQVYVLGHPSAGAWTISVGTVIKTTSPNEKINKFTISRDSSLAEGDSGGLVYDATGAFLGMHIESGAKYGVETKSDEILGQLAAWHVPTNNITTVPVSQPDAGSVLQAERDAIATVIDAYMDSYNKRDAKALWKIWPDAPDKTKQAVKSYFDSAQSISMKVTDRRVETNGSKATVMGQSSQEFKPKNGNTMKSPESPITIELEKRNGAWLITVVR